MPEVFSVVILSGTFLLFILLWFWVGLYTKACGMNSATTRLTGNGASGSGKPGSSRITGSRTLMSGRGRSCATLGTSQLLLSRLAGYSGQAVPEIRIEAIEHAEELREVIRSMVRGSPTRDDGTGSGKPSSVSWHSHRSADPQRTEKHPLSP